MILGAIGDDFTGSSDLGLMLARGGMRTVQYCGVPVRPAAAGVQAGIVALKTRSVPVEEAVAGALAALDWLRAQGARMFYFKYCSTFDSTPQGNIGPVIDALAAALGVTGPIPVCPAFPATGRTVYQGHLFVGDRLLSESGMEAHPLTPMTDPDIRRWLARQTVHGVGHLPVERLRRGEGRAVMAAEAAAGRPLVVADALADGDLDLLAQAAAGLVLWTGGSGLALGLPAVLGIAGAQDGWTGAGGPAIALAGSCSRATRTQIAAHAQSGAPVRRIDPDRIMSGEETPEAVCDWALAALADAGGVPLVHSSDDPAEVARVQARHGVAPSAQALEAFFGRLAVLAVEQGFDRIICAGGETSGAVVQALGAQALQIGPQIDPGVPAVRIEGRAVVLALKSGNFGRETFFDHAARVLAGQP